MDFHVLTGFLGSGKTTLLRAYLSRPEAAGTAVIVNEAGEMGLDGAILAEGRGGLGIAMLDNGCVCCAQGSELSATVENLLASLAAPPARIVLETSGLAKPGAVLRSLGQLAWLRMRIGVVSTFDCLRGEEIAGFEEAAAQWAGAQALILTRQDLAGPGRVRDADRMAQAINPLARIVRTADLAEAFAAPAANLGIPEIPVSHPRIIAFSARQSGPVAYDDLAAWLDNLAGMLGERLLRLKGIVRLGETPLLVQSVGTLFSAPRPFGFAGEGFLTVIARDTGAAELASVPPALPFAFTAPSPFRRAPVHVAMRQGSPT